MRRLIIGVNTTHPSRPPCIACSCVGYTGCLPYPQTLKTYLKHTLGWTFTQHQDPQKAIQAAAWRTLEKLYLNRYITNPNFDNIRLLLKPRYRKYEKSFESEVLIVRSHWLISTANLLLNRR